MTQAPSPIRDPFIDEVRDRRKAMLARFDYDLELLYQAIRRRQDEHPEGIVDRRGRSDEGALAPHSDSE